GARQHGQDAEDDEALQHAVSERRIGARRGQHERVNHVGEDEDRNPRSEAEREENLEPKPPPGGGDVRRAIRHIGHYSCCRRRVSMSEFSETYADRGGPKARLYRPFLPHADPEDSRRDRADGARTGARDDLGRSRVGGRHAELDRPDRPRAAGDRQAWPGLPLRPPKDSVGPPSRRSPGSTSITPASRPSIPVWWR